jgi:hypothetical protein
MKETPWSAARTILAVGIGFTLIVYALLGTSSGFSCRQITAGGRNCTLTRHFLFKQDPFSALFDGSVIHWDNPVTGENAYRITLVSRTGSGTMPKIGGSEWKPFLEEQAKSFTQFPWQYLWQGIIYNRNILIVGASFFALFWIMLLFATLYGGKMR